MRSMDLVYVFSILLDVRAGWLGGGQLSLPGSVRLTFSVSGWVWCAEGQGLVCGISVGFTQTCVPTAFS